MKSEVVEAGDYKLTISEANVLIGMKRARLKVEGDRARDTDPDRLILRLLVYPDLVAPVIEHEGFAEWPISFEDFLALPEQVVIPWEDAVYRLNPHWRPDNQTSEEKKESQMTSTPELDNG